MGMRFVLGSCFDRAEVSNAHRHLIDGLPRARELPNEVCCGHFCVVFVTVGGDVADSAGYLIRGTITVEDDPDQAMTHRMIDRYEAGTPRAASLREAWKDDDIVVLRLRPTSVVSVWG